MKITKYSNKGSRQENQDHINYELLEDNKAIFVVTDGMGGYSHGDVASHIVADAIVDSVSVHYKEEKNVARLVAEAYDYANETLAIKRIALGGCQMGAVVVSVFYDGEKAHITWLGDSRCYIIRNHKIVYQTEDHSILSQLRKIKTLRGYEEDRYASIVTRCIMGDDKLGKIETVKVQLNPKDIMVLCTDGFHKELDVEMLLSEDNLIQSLDERAEQMNDNFTFLKIEL